MTIIHKLNRNKYKCDVCGKIDFWSDSWWWYGSEAMCEVCNEDVPTLCSDQCFKEFRMHMAKGMVRLPKLRKHKNKMDYVKVTEREGY